MGYEYKVMQGNLKCMKGTVMFALPLKKGVCYYTLQMQYIIIKCFHLPMIKLSTNKLEPI